MANIPEPLIDYELDPNSLSLSGRRQQLKSRLAIQRRNSDGSAAARKGIARTLVLLALPYETALSIKSFLNNRVRRRGA